MRGGGNIFNAVAAGVIAQQTDQRTGVIDRFTYGFRAVVAMARVQGEDRLTLTLKDSPSHMDAKRRRRRSQISE